MSPEKAMPISVQLFQQSAGAGPSNRDWWPNQLKLNILRNILPHPTDGS
jgi:catalase (peroxidase I)